MLKNPWSSKLATTREPRNPVDPVTRTRSLRPMITLTPRYERKDVETIVLQLEELLGDLLDAVPRLCPTLGSRWPEDGGTVNLCAKIAEDRTIHEKRAPAPEAGG